MFQPTYALLDSTQPASTQMSQLLTSSTSAAASKVQDRPAEVKTEEQKDESGKDKDPKAGIHPLKLAAQKIDLEAIKARYAAERAKRLRTDGVGQFTQPKGRYARFVEDVLTPQPIPRDPIKKDTKVLIVGAGFAGIITAVKLKKDYGIDDMVLVDKAGGLGGTWYWNQYPGVACDVEAYTYLPFLEETAYLPEDRYAYGPEIRKHVQRIATKWDLARHTYLQTEISSMVWDSQIHRWHVRTKQSDHFTTQFVVLATGAFHEPKLPGLRGLDIFERPHFHSCRWDYGMTGGTPDDWTLSKLQDKTVAIIGTGASAVQLVPQLAKWAKKLLVFQRTPTSILIRPNFKTAHDPYGNPVEMAKMPGWQRARMEDTANIFLGTSLSTGHPSLEGLDAITVASIYKEARDAGVDVKQEEIPELLGLADFRFMEKLRKLIEDTVHDKATAESLKPWYSFMCKRPTSHSDYLTTFNLPNVELVDTDGQGVSHLTKTTVVANHQEFDVDLLVYSTGFDYETDADFHRRTGIDLVGVTGKTLDETWKDGARTLFGVHYQDFPNLFSMGTLQAGLGANWTHSATVSAEHISSVIAAVLSRGDELEAIAPTEEATEGWGKQLDEGSKARLGFLSKCTPGYFNKQGKPEEIESSRLAVYTKGLMEWERQMKEWREEGSFEGMVKYKGVCSACEK